MSETPQDPAAAPAQPGDEIDLDALVADWLSLAEVGSRLGLQIGRVKQLVRERQLIAVRRAPGTGPVVPAVFLDGDRIRKGLPGTLTLLYDAGYDERETLRWLFTTEEALDATPMQALVEERGKAVHRVAQILGF